MKHPDVLAPVIITLVALVVLILFRIDGVLP